VKTLHMSHLRKTSNAIFRTNNFAATLLSVPALASDLDATKALQIYRNNPARFEALYAEKTIIATGTISRILSEDPIDRRWSMSLGNPPVYGISIALNNSDGVLCFVYKREIAAQFEPGQKVRIRGTVGPVNSSGKSFSMNDCDIQPMN